MSAEPRSDAELVRAWQGGDEAAAAELVGRHSTALARFLAGLGADPGELEDLVQEAFFRAFTRLASWRGDAAFRSWLFTIGGNLARDHHRRGKGRGTVVELDERDAVVSGDPGSELEASDAEARLTEGLARLPRLQREVFLLRAQQGLDYEAIASALDTTAGAARVHYHRAVKRLKELVR